LWVKIRLAVGPLSLVMGLGKEGLTEYHPPWQGVRGWLQAGLLAKDWKMEGLGVQVRQLTVHFLSSLLAVYWLEGVGAGTDVEDCFHALASRCLELGCCLMV